jgi:hypothetical protein
VYAFEAATCALPYAVAFGYRRGVTLVTAAELT